MVQAFQHKLANVMDLFIGIGGVLDVGLVKMTVVHEIKDEDHGCLGGYIAAIQNGKCA